MIDPEDLKTPEQKLTARVAALETRLEPPSPPPLTRSALRSHAFYLANKHRLRTEPVIEDLNDWQLPDKETP